MRLLPFLTVPRPARDDGSRTLTMAVVPHRGREDRDGARPYDLCGYQMCPHAS